MYIGNKAYQNKVFRMLYDNATVLLDAGKAVDVTVAEHKVKRTNAQNNYYFLFNGELAKFLNESGLSYGEYKLPYTTELVHEINKSLFGVSTTTKMKKDEFFEYMTKLMSFWTEKTAGQFIMSESPYGYLEKVGYV